MIETIATAIAVGMLSAGVTGYISFLVFRQRVLGMEQLFREQLTNASQASSSALAALAKRVDGHSDTLKRVIYKDACDACKERQMDRHNEILRRMEKLEAEMKDVTKTVKDCFADLVEALRSDRMRREPGE